MTQDVRHWMVTEAAAEDGEPRPHVARFESIGLRLPETRLTTSELLARTKHRTGIQLERLTGIHERRVASDGEDSLSLAVGAARDCLAHSGHRAADLDMVVSCSISKHLRRFDQRLEPPLSMYIKDAIGAPQALSFDVSNACAGMLTGVFILNDFIRRGEISRGMVVSGECISQLGTNASTKVRNVMSRQLASLTLGDAGAAVIVERAPDGHPGIVIAGFTTLAAHSRLCVGFPSKVGPGGTMYTRSRSIHRAAIADGPPLVEDMLATAGLQLDDIDWFIPHQTSARAIRQGVQEFGRRTGRVPKNTVVNLEEYGNTSSTTHFVALYRYLQEGRIRPGERVLLLALASGLEIGVILLTMDEMVNRYGSSVRSSGDGEADPAADIPRGAPAR